MKVLHNSSLNQSDKKECYQYMADCLFDVGLKYKPLINYHSEVKNE